MSQAITSKELNKNSNYFTVGQLKEWIEKYNIPDSACILMQRVEDNYFEKHNWETIKKEGYWYHILKRHNKRIDEGYFLNKENFPNIKGDEEFLKKYSDKEMEEIKDEYYPCFSPVFYDNEFLYLDAHY